MDCELYFLTILAATHLIPTGSANSITTEDNVAYADKIDLLEESCLIKSGEEYSITLTHWPEDAYIYLVKAAAKEADEIRKEIVNPTIYKNEEGWVDPILHIHVHHQDDKLINIKTEYQSDGILYPVSTLNITDHDGTNDVWFIQVKYEGKDKRGLPELSYSCEKMTSIEAGNESLLHQVILGKWSLSRIQDGPNFDEIVLDDEITEKSYIEFREDASVSVNILNHMNASFKDVVRIDCPDGTSGDCFDLAFTSLASTKMAGTPCELQIERLISQLFEEGSITVAVDDDKLTMENTGMRFEFLKVAEPCC